MKKAILSRSFAGLLIAFFLSAPVLSSLLSSSYDCKKQDYVLTKKSGSPSKSDSLLPFEEREKEKRSGDPHAFTSICVTSDATPSLAVTFLYSWSYTPSLYIDNTRAVPLYLSKRTLLI